MALEQKDHVDDTATRTHRQHRAQLIRLNGKRLIVFICAICEPEHNERHRTIDICWQKVEEKQEEKRENRCTLSSALATSINNNFFVFVRARI